MCPRLIGAVIFNYVDYACTGQTYRKVNDFSTRYQQNSNEGHTCCATATKDPKDGIFAHPCLLGQKDKRRVWGDGGTSIIS